MTAWEKYLFRRKFQIALKGFYLHIELNYFIILCLYDLKTSIIHQNVQNNQHVATIYIATLQDYYSNINTEVYIYLKYIYFNKYSSKLLTYLLTYRSRLIYIKIIIKLLFLSTCAQCIFLNITPKVCFIVSIDEDCMIFEICCYNLADLK